MAIKGFEDLRIWQAAHALALQVYETTAGFPASELYGLTSQVRRAAASIAANIAEGYGRFSKSEYVHFLYYARGSLMDTKSFIYLARDVGYLDASAASVLLDTIDRLGVKLNNTIAAMKRAQGSKVPTAAEVLVVPGSTMRHPSGTTRHNQAPSSIKE